LRSNAYSFPVDLWAVGAMFAELITLRPLFPGQSEIDQVFRICELLGSPNPSSTYVGGVQRRMSEKKASPGFARKRSESIKVESPIISTSYTLPDHATPVGGGEWREGVKLAAKIGFQFPKVGATCYIGLHRLHFQMQTKANNRITSKIPPKPFISVLPNATPSMLDLLEHLMYYDPKLRLSAEAAMSHPFFLEVEETDEQNSREGTGGSNQESQDPDNTSPEKKEGRGLERHGTNRGIVITDETQEEKLQRSHQRMAFISENDHLMRRGKKEKSSNKAASTILGKRSDGNMATANRAYGNVDITPLSLQKSPSKAQFDLPAIPLSPFDFSEGWPPQRKASISSFTGGPILTMDPASGTVTENSIILAASIHELLQDMRPLSDDSLMKQTPLQHSPSQRSHTDRFSAPSSYQETTLRPNLRPNRRALSSEDHHLQQMVHDERDASKIQEWLDTDIRDMEIKRHPYGELQRQNVFSLTVKTGEPTDITKQNQRPHSDVPHSEMRIESLSVKRYSDTNNPFKLSAENIPPPPPDVPPPMNSSASTPLSSVARQGTFRKLVGRTGIQSAHRNPKPSPSTIPRSVTYESLQTSSPFVKKQERHRISHRFRQAASQGESTKHHSTGGSSGFFSFKKWSPGVLKDSIVHNPLLRQDNTNPLHEDIPFQSKTSTFDMQSPAMIASSARPSEYHFRPHSVPTVGQQPSPFELLIAEEIEQAWAPQSFRLPQVTNSLPQDHRRYL
jgi:Protein kinase domain